MKFNTTRLLVNDMSVSMAFYKDTLGLPVRFGDPDGVYTEFVLDDEISLALYGRGMMADVVGTGQLANNVEAQDRFTITFVVEDLDATVAALAEKGLHPSTPITDRPLWMLRTVHYRDPDGNLIEIHAGLPES